MVCHSLYSQFLFAVSPNAQIALGYQFNPVWAVRLGVNAWQSKGGWKEGSVEAVGLPHKTFSYNYFAPAVDVKFNIINAFAGWNPERVFTMNLIAGGGVNIASGLGLKAGIYSDAGANTCGNYYGGDTIANNVGLYRHDQQDCDFFFKELDFDFIKVDFCGADAPQNRQRYCLDPQERYTAISKAMEKTGKKGLRLNVCRWDYPGTWVHDVATSWRMSVDINCSWPSVRGIIDQSLSHSEIL